MKKTVINVFIILLLGFAIPTDTFLYFIGYPSIFNSQKVVYGYNILFLDVLLNVLFLLSIVLTKNNGGKTASHKLLGIVYYMVNMIISCSGLLLLVLLSWLYKLNLEYALFCGPVLLVAFVISCLRLWTNRR